MQSKGVLGVPLEPFTPLPHSLTPNHPAQPGREGNIPGSTLSLQILKVKSANFLVQGELTKVGGNGVIKVSPAHAAGAPEG